MAGGAALSSPQAGGYRITPLGTLACPVVPMSAYVAGLDLVELLLPVSSGKSPADAARSRAGVRTRLGMQSLLGRGLRGGPRRELLGELRRVKLIEREVVA
jgi:hypothetical protein